MTGIAGTSWQSVQRELLRRINEGAWSPGGQVPNEADLAAEFGCARTTVNRAMRALADAGLLDRRRRAGTRVALHPTSRVVLAIPVIRLEVEARGHAWRQQVLERAVTVPPTAVSRRLAVPADTEMLHVVSLHFADDAPFLCENRWINLAALPGAAEADFAAVSANEWLLANVPYTTGEIAFSAVAADQELAARLDVATGAALFTIDRATWNDGAPITAVRLSYAPGYRLETRF